MIGVRHRVFHVIPAQAGSVNTAATGLRSPVFMGPGLRRADGRGPGSSGEERARFAWKAERPSGSEHRLPAKRRPSFFLSLRAFVPSLEKNGLALGSRTSAGCRGCGPAGALHLAGRRRLHVGRAVTRVFEGRHEGARWKKSRRFTEDEWVSDRAFTSSRRRPGSMNMVACNPVTAGFMGPGLARITARAGTGDTLLRRLPLLRGASRSGREEADVKTDDRDDLPCFRGHFQTA